jgi:uncharacterized protein YebE (UPF0316 family)
MTEFLLIFIVLSIINVVFSTIRSIVTIKGGKWTAALMSGGYFAFYNIVMMWTVADFPMWQKCLITFVCNVIGVLLVKWGEERFRKDKLWVIFATLKNEDAINLRNELNALAIENAYIPNLGKHTKFEIYSYTQEESRKAKALLSKYNAKYCAIESKSLD